MNSKLQIFISSTYTDLKSERQAAVEAILDLSEMNLNNNPMNLAQQVLKKVSGHKKWQPIVRAEQEKLKQELIDLGFW